MTTTLSAAHCTATAAKLYVALELSSKQWKLAFTTQLGQNPRQRCVAAGNLPGLLQEIDLAKARLKLDPQAQVHSCYEAGRDGFWIHRFLQREGIDNVVIDPSSIEVNRRARRAKTDRIDALRMVALLCRYHEGDKHAFRMVRVPSVAEEDRRQLHRDLQEMKAQRTQHSNRIQSLLVTLGLDLEVNADFAEQLPQLRDYNGDAVPAAMQERLLREHQRWELVDQQIRQAQRQQRQEIRQGTDPVLQGVRQLLSLKGVGVVGAWVLVQELFSWRQIDNRRELAALVGLTPVPYQSGDSCTEQGISKAGNRRVRSLMIELAWSWLRWQPQSELSQWFQKRFAQGRRARKVGIVALARKLLIALWRYWRDGEVPPGAVIVPWQNKLG